jgi:mannitol-specific phosphotransferase system IIBC component
MKEKLPAFLFMLAIPLSIVLYLKVETASGSEIVALLAAVACYLVVFFLLALFFNSRAKDANGKATSALDNLFAEKKTKAERAREEILRKQQEIAAKRNAEDK